VVIECPVRGSFLEENAGLNLGNRVHQVEALKRRYM
jgi:hypothetical protein